MNARNIVLFVVALAIAIIVVFFVAFFAIDTAMARLDNQAVAAQPTNVPDRDPKSRDADTDRAEEVAQVPTLTPTPTVYVIPSLTPTPGAEATAEVAAVYTADGAGFTVVGAPQQATNVEVVQGNYANTLGLGSQMLLAEPGKINYDCVNQDVDMSLIAASNGAAQCLNELNHDRLGAIGGEGFILPEGGMSMLSLGGGTIEVDTVTITLEYRPGHTWLLYVRGFYGDAQRDTDRNNTLLVTGYAPGHVEAQSFSSNPNGGFVSEEQMLQVVASAQGVGNHNCGDGGCTAVSVLLYDVNTRGWAAMTKVNPDAQWISLGSNWWTAS